MKIFDMSQELYNGCPGWPTFKLFDVQYEAVIANDFCTAERMDLNVHTGTHLDAPFHFVADGATIDEFPIDAFIGKAHIINLEGIAPKAGILKSHIEKYVDKIQKGDIVLFYTGWCRKRSYSEEYMHDWPYVTGEAAELLRDLGVKGVGTDGLSIGGFYDGSGLPSHRTLLGSGIWLLEELNFPEELLKYETCELTAVPLKLRGFGGSPTRAYAKVD